MSLFLGVPFFSVYSESLSITGTAIPDKAAIRCFIDPRDQQMGLMTQPTQLRGIVNGVHHRLKPVSNNELLD
ncbi:MAG: hypothetical protein ACE5EC_03115 [Phycisphaerae bacterium]